MSLMCPQEPNLSPTNPAQNTAAIEQIVLATGGGHARIPKGSFPVHQIRIGRKGRISGCGIGLSELKLAVPPVSPDLMSILITSAAGIAANMMVNDLTLDGNDVSDANGVYGIVLDGCRDSIFRNLEIKNCWTGGIFIKEWQSPGGPQGNKTPTNCLLSNMNISRCGKYGVFINSAERIQLRDFDVREIGRSVPGAQWPKAALDIKPGQLETLVTSVSDITISNWNINVAGQGVLVRAEDSEEPSAGILLSNIICHDILGNNMLLMRNVDSFAGFNVNCRKFSGNENDPTDQPVAGIRFENAKGTISNLSGH